MFIPNKVLIVRFSSIGDIVLTTPLIRAIKEKFPHCIIDFIIKDEYTELITFHPLLNKIYAFDKQKGIAELSKIKKQIRQEKYDIIIDIHKNIRSIYLRSFIRAKQIVTYKKFIFNRWLLVHLKLNRYQKIIPIYQRYIDCMKNFELVYDDQGLDLFIPPTVTETIQKRWQTHDNHLICGIAPGASFKTKQWSLDGFIEISNYLLNKYNAKIFLFGDKLDHEITSQITSSIKNNHLIDLAGKLSLLESAAMMNFCQLVITNDTGLMHIAAALKKKIVAIFGSTTEELGFFPNAKQFVVLQSNDLICRPCSHIGRNTCPKKHFKCMRDISADKVKQAVDFLLLSNL